MRALAGTIGWLAAALATTTSVYTDDVHLVDSTPIECARSRPTVMRSDLAGWAGYGYCASHSRFFWGLRLHLVCTAHGLPVAWAVTSPGQDEREVLRSMLEHLAPTSARTIIADKGYRSKDLEDDLNQAGLTLLRPAARNEAPRPGAGLLRPLRQRIESVFDTLKDQLGLERHNGRTPTGVTTRRPTHPGPDSRHLAQRQNRQPPPTLPDPLRPLTNPLGINHLACSGVVRVAGVAPSSQGERAARVPPVVRGPVRGRL